MSAKFLVFLRVAACAAFDIEDSVSLLQHRATITQHRITVADDSNGLRDGQPCGGDVMGFRLANVTRNNLGNMHGPDSGEEGIFISNVFPDSGRDISLVLNANTGYTPHKLNKNGLWKNGEFMQINVRCGTEVDVQFTFVDSETLQPVIIPAFYMTFYDLDEMKKGVGREYVTFRKPVQSTHLSANTVVARAQDADKITFSSSTFGVRKDNPTHPRTLTEDQENKAVSVFFPSGSHFVMTWGAEDSPPDQLNGRNILFSGASTLACPRVAMCSSAECPSGYKAKPFGEYIACNAEPCDMSSVDDRDRCCDYNGLCNDDARMNFRVSTVSRNNLGGQGPNDNDPEGIMYDNVFPDGGKTINLLVSAESDYQLVAKGNGLNPQNTIARINIRSDTETDFSFNFIDADSGEPAEVGPFFMTFLDFDESRKDLGREYLTVRGHGSFSLTDETLVSAVGAGDGSHTFRSTVYGIGKDNAKDPAELTLDQMHKSVALAFPRLSSFKATFGVGPAKGKYGRNINFAGFSNMVCNDDVSLDEFHAGVGRSNRVPEESTFDV